MTVTTDQTEFDARTATQAIRDLPQSLTFTARRQAERDLEGRWKDYLRTLYTNVNPAQFNLLFAKAWEDGHSYGLEEVESYLIDLMSLFDALRYAGE